MSHFPNNQSSTPQSPLVLLQRKGQNKFADVFVPKHLALPTKQDNAPSVVPAPSNSGVHQNTDARMSASIVMVNDELEIVNFLQVFNSYTFLMNHTLFRTTCTRTIRLILSLEQ